MSIESKVNRLMRLNRANDDALRIIGDLCSICLSQDGAVDSLFHEIRIMGNCLADLFVENSPYARQHKREEYLRKLRRRIDHVESKLRRYLDLDFGDSINLLQISPAIRDTIGRKMQDAVARINPCLEGRFSPDDAKFMSLVTAHDLVRYMHTVAIEMTFNPDTSNWELKKGEGVSVFYDGGLQYYLLAPFVSQVDEFEQKYPYLQRFREIGRSCRFLPKYKDVDQFYILGTEDRLSLQMPLGYHLANMVVSNPRDSGSPYVIDFKFVDTTGYRASEFRSAVTHGILHCYGYDVRRRKNVITVHHESLSLEESLDCYENLLRLGVSLKDLDLVTLVRRRDRFADTIDAYFHGVLNLACYLNTRNAGQWEGYAKDGGCYRAILPEDIYTIRLASLSFIDPAAARAASARRGR